MTPKEVLILAKAKEVKIVDFKFADIHGAWQHFCIPAAEFSQETFEKGLGFDGSSIRGWKTIEASDMLVIPDPTTAIIDPFAAYATLSLICDIEDPITREPYERSPRGVARKAEAYLKSSVFADTAFIGPEAEFFVFDDVRYNTTANESFYSIDSNEGIWNAGKKENPNQSYKIRHKEGYLPTSPADKLIDLRSEMMMTMIGLGIEVECAHHEVATGGQCEIDIRFNTLLKVSDQLTLFKYVIKNVAYRNGKTATFMPKPIFGDNGSGMHVHSSLWKGGKPLFAGERYAGLSQMGLYYIGGLLKHAPSLSAICNPSTNSYKRLVPGFEAPVILAYSARNRSAICRIPTYDPSSKAKRVEFRSPDPSANPYLTFSAIVMAGLDGIENKIDPGEPMDKNLYDLPPEEATHLQLLPESMESALEALTNDHAYLLKGNVFTKDFLDNFITLKKNELNAIRLRPHPYEYALYYDV